MRNSPHLSAALNLPEGATPFPWQERLLSLFSKGSIPSALDLPTGLGKTSVIAIWLVALAAGAQVPRRLVYVVDRRAVVDQSTKVAEELRAWVDANDDVKAALGLENRPLPISTLRGQYVDNREWLDDPSAPAIIVGTVDMIGSRLLFSGYGVSRKMRPYHAGLLGRDTLFVVDESHLVPPFEQLLRQVARRKRGWGEARPKVLALSATGERASTDFGLEDKDFKHPIVEARLNAAKRLRLEEAVADKELAEALARRAWEVAEVAGDPSRVLVFCNRREDATTVAAALSKIAKKHKAKGAPLPAVELFVGGRRVFERHAAAARLETLGFLAGDGAPGASHAFLVATSAAEVGVDLDADHMVADLVPWERMVQRLGRVNRRGGKASEVIVIPSEEGLAGKWKDNHTGVDLARVHEVVEQLRRDDEHDAHDASPASLLEHRGSVDTLGATTPKPLHPSLDEPTIDAWAMTSLAEHTGRPKVTPWLRGWVDEKPQTQILWRTHLPHGDAQVEQLLEAAPPHLAETLTVETYAAAQWLDKLRKQIDKSNQKLDKKKAKEDRIELRAVLRGSRNEEWRWLDFSAPKRLLEAQLRDATLVVHAKCGGLSSDGLLDEKQLGAVSSADGGSPWRVDDADDPIVPWRVRTNAGQHDVADDEGWRERARIEVPQQGDNPDAEPEIWIVERWKNDAKTEDDRAMARCEQSLEQHHQWTQKQAEAITGALDVPEPFASLVVLAARLHDEGKRAKVWQDAFSAPAKDRPFAKTKGPLRIGLLSKYRHEFGSLRYVREDAQFNALDPADQDVVLHLVVAHHGWGRPFVSVEGCDHAPRRLLREEQREVALRFVRVQARLGAWGLAYLETLVRAADQRASQQLENVERTST